MTVEKNKLNPRVKDVLKLLAAGAILTTVILFPGIAAASVFMKQKERDKWEKAKKEWGKFNLWRLRQVINRLEKQKIVEIVDDEVKITEKGREKILKFDLDRMELKREIDGKWRLVIYDIANLRKTQREHFREMLKKMRFLQLQKSVYLTPFKWEDEIEYLRQLFNIKKEVQIIKVANIENEEAYRKYFGI